MEIIKIIRDIDLGFDYPKPESYRERTAARAVVFDELKNIALLNVSKKFYHKLPGGGLENEEDLIQTLEREVKEEIGCDIENIIELGIIEEFRNASALHQISYCFIANVKGEKGSPNMEEDEIAEGFKVEWHDLDSAIKIISDENNIEDVKSSFVGLRDLTFLKSAKSKLI